MTTDPGPTFPSAPLGRRTVLGAALTAPLAVGLLSTRPAHAADMIEIHQEPDELEARFPDLLTLDDGQIMAVWQTAAEHTDSVGEIQLSFGNKDGTSWSDPHKALHSDGSMEGKDKRDPKIGKMADGSVVLTFFGKTNENESSKVWYSVWKTGWQTFTTPEPIASGASHGPVLALADKGDVKNEVLIPYYVGGSYTSGLDSDQGAWYLRARWDAPANELVPEGSPVKLLANANPRGRVYTEPNLIQFGDTVIGVVRAEQYYVPGQPEDEADYISPVIARWNPYSEKPEYTLERFGNVLANSHHLLKTSDDKVLFTYGDRARTGRPTVGMLISDPASTWTPTTAVSIYDSGHGDQGNPSSVELPDDSFLTAGYNAKSKSKSSSGGTLWGIPTSRSQYA